MAQSGGSPGRGPNRAGIWYAELNEGGLDAITWSAGERASGTGLCGTVDIVTVNGGGRDAHEYDYGCY